MKCSTSNNQILIAQIIYISLKSLMFASLVRFVTSMVKEDLISSTRNVRSVTSVYTEWWMHLMCYFISLAVLFVYCTFIVGTYLGVF